MWVQCGTEYLHLMPLSNSEFRESQLIKSHRLFQGVNKMLPLFSAFFLQTWVKFRVEDICTVPLSSY